MSLPPHLEAGQDAERRALEMLEGAGLKLLTRNYHCPQGELDLVLMDRETLVVAEVRYRKDASRGTPAETVGHEKQRKLVLATRHFLSTHADLRRKPLRFDVVAVTAGVGPWAVEWLKDAFQAD
ncbi:MAG TPA: YraN family protein [Gammaproteobacteria bacterium]|nr:YraN family protein [Gammaproteobacteria bacterium]